MSTEQNTVTRAHSVDMRHMVNPSSFHWNGKFCVEGRDPETGRLDMSVKLPFMEATCDGLFQHYWRNNPVANTASQETVAKWYNDQKIFFRPKTW